MILLDPDQRADACEQLRLVKRFHDEVVCPGLERLQLLLSAARGDHHYGKELRSRRRADAPAQLISVHLGHDDVEQDQIGPRLERQPLESLRSRVDALDLIAACAEHRLEQVDVRSGVVHDQNAGERRIHVSTASGVRWARTYDGSSRTFNGFSR